MDTAKLKGTYDAGVRAFDSATGMPLQEQAVKLHDPVNALVLNSRLISRLEPPIQGVP